MSIEIFSRCPFTTTAFTCLGNKDNGNVPITVVDIEHGIDMTLLTHIITDRQRTFIIILNNRKHAPVMVAQKVLLLSKHASIMHDQKSDLCPVIVQGNKRQNDIVITE
ncbi:hypothetical protein ACIPUO_11240 [Pectobacterium carotovorum]|uniref:hypothetical protein n=1 Tax=Pectobacterium carotovorum TaxID=554 RepID=UPI0037FEBCB3